ncbi:hypothetical protein PagCFBP13532_21350 [Pantoea agglomerans]|nr:hypothetical protein PagCFBP13505_16645 [Pantoea agglomerans]TKK14366.1 hypothetical protein PagCFBP13516_22060 [Pantoea agglomerans]TKK27297.1 hypothetical protein PagCFBP13532_21350 [Pantoea agglomerans]
MRETGFSDRLSQDDESMGQIKQEKRACEAREKLQRFFQDTHSAFAVRAVTEVTLWCLLRS